MIVLQEPWSRLYRLADRVTAPDGVRNGQTPNHTSQPSLLPQGFQAVEVLPPSVLDPEEENRREGGKSSDPMTRLDFGGRPLKADVLALRLTFAANVKEEIELEAQLAESRRSLGSFDVRYAYSKQMFEIAVPPGLAKAIYREGIGLRMVKGTMPVWLLWSEEPGDAAAFAPHLLLDAEVPVAGGDADMDTAAAKFCVAEGGPAAAAEPCSPAAITRLALFYRQLQSPVCYHRSGWMEGCVLDGLYDIYRQTGRPEYLLAVRQHLRQFLTDNSGPEEQAGPRVQNGKIVADVTERTLPYAVLAHIEPEHPALDALIASWQMEKREDGAVFDRETDTITGEGVYTAGYPMAAVAMARGRDDLAELALRQLHSRKERLVAASGIYLRSDAAGRCTYLNWARAWAWYLLGAARTLIELREWEGRHVSRSYANGVQEFARAASVAASMQLEDGLWAVFTDDPATGAEAGGSAGIATAFALGARYGLLDAGYRSKAEAAWLGLLRKVTPDGLLGGVSQTNQGGEELQRSGYRVLFQMGMGLTAQLGAALGKPVDG